MGDDILAVAVDCKTSLISQFGAGNQEVFTSWKEPENPRLMAGPSKLRHGDWFAAKKGGDHRPRHSGRRISGTAFGAWLLIEKKGVEYPVVDSPHGKLPAYPVFQVRKQALPEGNYGVPSTTAFRHGRVTNNPLGYCSDRLDLCAMRAGGFVEAGGQTLIFFTLPVKSSSDF